MRLLCLLPVALFSVGAVAQQAGAQSPPAPAPQTQNSSPKAGDAGQGDVLMPLPENQQPANAGKEEVPPAQEAPPSQTQNPSPKAGDAGQGDVLMPLPENQQPANAGKEEVPPPAQPAPNQPGDTVEVPGPAQGNTPSGEVGGIYVFKAQVEEVVLHATVVDERNHLINDLDRDDFTVLENGVQQRLTSFRHEDFPVALGIVIDNSGSMRDKRPAVNQAALNLVRSSNPRDEVFVVNFNDEYWLDQDFTGEIAKLQEALDHIEARGGTALYDAVVASADHLKKNARLEKKVLLVVTDGEDNASGETLEQAVKRVQVENGPTVYTIGILGSDSHQKRAKRALLELAEDTGGVAFFPKDLNEVENITNQIAHDIRNQYTIGYKSSTPQTVGGYRTIKVVVKSKKYKQLQVRTRSGYYAGQQTAQK